MTAQQIEGDVLRQWNATVAVRGDRTALVDAKRSYTYRELDRAARAVARQLAAIGVRPGDLVGIYAGRGFTWFAAMLGTLGSEAAFVPVDVEYPQDRIQHILNLSKPRILLADNVGAPMAAASGVPFLDLGEADLLLGPQPPRLREPNPRSLAYVVFTSGSSGIPKGVMIEHRSLGNTVREAVCAYGFTAADRVLQFNSLSFDTAYEEIYPAFAVGAALVLRQAETAASAEHFWRHCAREQVTIVDLTPAFWQELVDVAVRDPAKVGDVRMVILGGDRLPPRAVAAWQGAAELLDRCALMTSYGPTETTIIVSAGVAAQAEAPGRLLDEIPIGEPIANVRLHVVGPDGGPAATGELWIAGVNLARGYYGDPRTTAERFRPNPWPAEPGERIYSSRDAARVHDGSFSITGRMDRQVKIRGFRVDPAELEAAAARIPGVQRAAVRPEVRQDGSKALVLYIACGESRLQSHAILAALRDVLPPHLLPEHLFLLDRLPLTMHGKVDYEALRNDQQEAPSPTASAIAGDGPSVLGIMREMLGYPGLSENDNFFECGGHSILAMRLLARLSEVLQLEMPLLDFFQDPTALAIEQHAFSQPVKGASDDRGD